MTPAQADELCNHWDSVIAAQVKKRVAAGDDIVKISAVEGQKRIMLWRVWDCVNGWRPYDADVAEALDTMKQTDQVREIREICEKRKEAPRES